MSPAPPACPAAETALLGAVLFAPQQAGQLLEGLDAEHVTTPAHQAVLEVMTGLLAAGVLPEPVAVLERLQRTGEDRTPVFCGRDAGVVLADLMEAVTTPAAAGYWRDLVVAYATRRRLVAVAVRLDQAARCAEHATLADVVADARRDLDHHQPQHRPQALGVTGVAGSAKARSDQVEQRPDRRGWEAA